MTIRLTDERLMIGAAPMIADPLRLLDCCQESAGAVAIVGTSQKRAAALAESGHRTELVPSSIKYAKKK